MENETPARQRCPGSGWLYLASVTFGAAVVLLAGGTISSLGAEVGMAIGRACGIVAMISWGVGLLYAHVLSPRSVVVDEVVQNVATEADTTVVDATLGAERAIRRLGAQVGEALSATARVTSQTVTSRYQAEQLADQVTSGASAIEEIVATIESQTQRIDQQRELVSQSAAAIAQVSSSISSIASITEQHATDSVRLRGATESGSAAVHTAEEAISDVSESVDAVDGMISVINDIAARTNLLAMNAAIEAAHAGSAGRGFAVVAAEIRKLAENTATNAHQISERLTTLIARIQDARTASAETQETFSTITTVAATVTDAFGAITDQSREVATGAHEVVSTSAGLQALSDEIAGGAVEMQSAVHEISGLISATRDSSHGTREAAQTIAAGARDFTTIINGITTLSMEANQHEREVLSRLAEQEREGALYDELQRADARLGVAQIVLKHVEWVGRVRSALDGTSKLYADELTDHTSCDLGVWLQTEGKTAIDDQDTYIELTRVHKEVHTLLKEFTRGTALQQDHGEAEQRFAELISHSNRIVELLSAYQQGGEARWSPDYAVDVELFDKHHQRLFALIDRLYESLKRNTAGDEVKSVIDELLQYTNYHFSAEERAFEHFNYPGCDKQKEQHAKLISEVKQLQTQLKSGKQLVAVEVMEFLRDWLVTHIKGCDRLYAEFFQDKDVREALARERSA